MNIFITHVRTWNVSCENFSLLFMVMLIIRTQSLPRTLWRIKAKYIFYCHNGIAQILAWNVILRMRNRKAAMKQQVQTGAYNVKSPAANKCFKNPSFPCLIVQQFVFDIILQHHSHKLLAIFAELVVFQFYFGFHFTLEKNHSSVPHKIEMRNFQWPINSHWNIRSFICLDCWDSLRAFILNWCIFDPFWQSTQLGIRTSIVWLHFEFSLLHLNYLTRSTESMYLWVNYSEFLSTLFHLMVALKLLIIHFVTISGSLWVWNDCVFVLHIFYTSLDHWNEVATNWKTHVMDGHEYVL